MLDQLLPICLTSVEEGLAYLRRETGDDRLKAIAALNQAAATLETLTGRKLAFRTYRDQTQIANVNLTAASTVVTGAATAGAKIGDAVISSSSESVRPGSQIVAVSSLPTATLNVPALETGTVVLTIGSAPELVDGTSLEAWTWNRTDWPIYTQESPIGEVFAIKKVETDGTKTAMDLTNARIQKAVGAIYLPNDMVNQGALTVEIHYSAGYRFPSFSYEGDQEAQLCQIATHRLAQANFQDWASGAGRATESTLGSASRRIGGFAIPDDVQKIIDLLRRQ